MNFTQFMISEAAKRAQGPSDEPQDLEVKGIVQRLLYDDVVGYLVGGKTKSRAEKKESGEDEDYYTSLDGINTPDELRKLNGMSKDEDFASATISKIKLTQMVEPESAREYEMRTKGIQDETKQVNAVTWAEENMPDLHDKIDQLAQRWADAYDAVERAEPDSPQYASVKKREETAERDMNAKIRLAHLLSNGGANWISEEDKAFAANNTDENSTNVVMSRVRMAYLDEHEPELAAEYRSIFGKKDSARSPEERDRKQMLDKLAEMGITGKLDLTPEQQTKLQHDIYVENQEKERMREDAIKITKAKVESMDNKSLASNLAKAKGITEEDAIGELRKDYDGAKRELSEWLAATRDYEPKKLGSVDFRGRYEDSYKSGSKLTIYVPAAVETSRGLEYKLEKYTYRNYKSKKTGEYVTQFEYDPKTGVITLSEPLELPENNMVGKDPIKPKLGRITDINNMRAIYAQYDEDYNPRAFAEAAAKEKVSRMSDSEKIQTLAALTGKHGEKPEAVTARAANIEKEYNTKNGAESVTSKLVVELAKNPDPEMRQAEKVDLTEKIAKAAASPRPIRYKIQKFMTYAPEDKPFLPTRIMGVSDAEDMVQYQYDGDEVKYVVAMTSKKDWEHIEKGDVISNTPGASDIGVRAGITSASAVTKKELVDKFNKMSDDEFAEEFAVAYGMKENEVRGMMSKTKSEEDDEFGGPKKIVGRKEMTEQMAADLTGTMDKFFVKLTVVDKKGQEDESLPEPTSTINYWVRFEVDAEEMKKHGEERLGVTRSEEYRGMMAKEKLTAPYKYAMEEVRGMSDEQLVNAYSEHTGETQEAAKEKLSSNRNGFMDDIAWAMYNSNLVDLYVKEVPNADRQKMLSYLETNREAAITEINKKLKPPKAEPKAMKEPKVVGMEPSGKWVYDWTGLNSKDAERFKQYRKGEGYDDYVNKKELDEMSEDMLRMVYKWLELGDEKQFDQEISSSENGAKDMAEKISAHVSDLAQKRRSKIDVNERFGKISKDKEKVRTKYQQVMREHIKNWTDEYAVEEYAEIADMEESEAWDAIEEVGREKFNEMLLNTIMEETTISEMIEELEEYEEQVYDVSDEEMAEEYVRLFTTHGKKPNYEKTLDGIRKNRGMMIHLMSEKQKEVMGAAPSKSAAEAEKERAARMAKIRQERAQAESSPFRDKLEDMSDDEILDQFAYRLYPDQEIPSDREKLIDAVVKTQQKIMAARFSGENMSKVAMDDDMKKRAYNYVKNMFTMSDEMLRKTAAEEFQYDDSVRANLELDDPEKPIDRDAVIYAVYNKKKNKGYDVYQHDPVKLGVRVPKPAEAEKPENKEQEQEQEQTQE